MAINKLTQSALRTAKSTQKPYKLSDGGGLYLLVNPNGALWWRFEYQFEGREKLLSLGVYPHVSLQQPRALRDEAKRALPTGWTRAPNGRPRNPLPRIPLKPSARLALQEKKLAPAAYAKAVWTLDTLVYPLHRLTSHRQTRRCPDVLKVLRRIEGRGTHETAHRTRQRFPKYFATPCKPSAPHMT